MTIVIQVNAPFGAEQEVNEALAMYLENVGPCRVVEIREDKVEQIKMGGV